MPALKHSLPHLIHGLVLAIPALLMGQFSIGCSALLILWVLSSALESPHIPSTRVGLPPIELLRGPLLLATLWVITLSPTAHGSIPLGVTLLLGGSALRLWAIHTLGSGFGSGLTPTIPLTGDGPYRGVAHPSEWGLLIKTSGAVILLGSAWGGLAWGLAVALPSALRMRLENRALQRATVLQSVPEPPALRSS